jgi:hypothetical protein
MDGKCFLYQIGISHRRSLREAEVRVLEATHREAYSSLHPYVNHTGGVRP